MNVHLEWFDGYEGADFDELADRVAEKYAESIAEGVQVHVFIESPCNPHGYVLDVPEICSTCSQKRLECDP